MTQIYEATAERLQSYHPFADGVVDTVSRVAELQSGMTCDEFLAQFGVPEPRMESIDGSHPVSVLRILPQVDYDPSRARVMDLGMGNGLMPNKNQVYQVATVFAGDPTVPTYAFGNPGGIKNREGLVSLRDAIKVFKGDTRHLIDASSRILGRDGVSQVERDAYSYGVLTATTATEHAESYEQIVTHVTAVDPADVTNRGQNLLKAMASLGIDFSKTEKAMQGYLDANQIDAFAEARADTRRGMNNYKLGLMRINNLARTSVLSNDKHESRVVRALESQPNATMHTIWASESELAKDALMNVLTRRLQFRFPGRFDRTRIANQTHLMVNDLALQSAIFLHARPSV